ncbi:DUF4862 family protein [Kineosporia rhizophila]|uniref:DUF4862 family protein n=1 Tax=Kineosporia rhizophila TaxID=84633 RepID=UPI001E5D2818|nr:DUF4862 family protein [Kineosporia rhizophila]MCE0538880.1 DUF4862 family protein [Kineosporia rhizophila]
MTSLEGLFLAAYITAPADPAGEDAFFDAVAELGLSGLEFALAPAGTRTLEPAWIRQHVRPDWDLVVSLVPSMMVALGQNPLYGLASDDETHRREALADVARARDLARTLADEYGTRRVAAIEVHSAPGPRGGSRSAFERSLTEILEWDLAGAELLVEHCDAYVPDQTPAKGFFQLSDEIAAVQSFGLPSDVLGMSLNWGRSAIEGHGPDLALEHIAAVNEAELLRAYIFSGATGEDTAWGPAWTDMHIPAHGSDAALASAAASLLGPNEIADTVKALGDVPRTGLKVAARPRDADVATHLAVVTANLTQIAQARAAG